MCWGVEYREMEYRALLTEYRALLMEYRALLIECRALMPCRFVGASRGLLVCKEYRHTHTYLKKPYNAILLRRSIGSEGSFGVQRISSYTCTFQRALCSVKKILFSLKKAHESINEL